MATADIDEYLSGRDWGRNLFSKQYCGQLAMKVVKVNGVVQKFIDSATTISEAEKKPLVDITVADKKLRHLLTILTNHCNRNDLGALKTFIDILGDTDNVATAQHLSLIYDERVNHVATLSELSKEKALVKKLENDISRLKRILDETKRCLESLRAEKKELVIQNETFREENLSLEKQKKKIEKNLLLVEEEKGELIRTKTNLENVIREREKQISEKERKVWEAVEESNRLRIEIDTLKKQQKNKAMVEDKEMSKKIEELEAKIGEKENIIKNLKENNTMTRKEVEEELGNLMKGHAEKLDYQMKIIKKQNDDQAAMIQQQKDDQAAMIQQHKDDQAAIVQQQKDDQAAMVQQQKDDQAALVQQHNDNMNAIRDDITRALNSQKKK